VFCFFAALQVVIHRQWGNQTDRQTEFCSIGWLSYDAFIPAFQNAKNRQICLHFGRSGEIRTKEILLFVQCGRIT